MKKYLLLTVLSIFIMAGTLSAQLRKIPAEVTDSFRKQFPQAETVEWRDRLSSFTASFNLDGTDYSASYNNDGEWLETEQGILEEELPEEVMVGFSKSRFADWKIEQYSRIDLPQDQSQYRIMVSKGDVKKRNLYFNAEGRLLSNKITL